MCIDCFATDRIHNPGLVEQPIPVAKLTGTDGIILGWFKIRKTKHGSKKLFFFIIDSRNSQDIFFVGGIDRFSQKEVAV